MFEGAEVSAAAVSRPWAKQINLAFCLNASKAALIRINHPSDRGSVSASALAEMHDTAINQTQSMRCCASVCVLDDRGCVGEVICEATASRAASNLPNAKRCIDLAR